MKGVIMLLRSWPKDQDRREIQRRINDCLKFVRNRLKGKVSAPVYLRCLWIESLLAACQAALDDSDRREVQKLLAEIDSRIVDLFKDR